MKLYVSLALLIISLAAASLFVGAGGNLIALFETDPDMAQIILWDVRLPRVLLGLIVGAGLGLSGAALQGLTRNPLAEPGLVGISSGAALGAVGLFYFGIFGTTAISLPLGGLIGAAVMTLLLLGLWGRGASVTSLVLAGVALNALANAMIALALTWAPSPFSVYEIVFWLMGSLADRSLDHVTLAAPFIIAGCALLLLSGRGLDALALGEDTAQSLGLALTRLRVQVVVGVALAVGASVAVTGAIGFVGLVVPHLVRPFVEHSPARSLLPSALGGAALTLAADIGVRLLSPGVEIRLGVVTAFIGVPFFLLLLLRARRELV